MEELFKGMSQASRFDSRF